MMGIIGDRKVRALRKIGLSLAVAASVLLAGCGGADEAGPQADSLEDLTEKERFQTEWKEQVSVWEGKWGPFDGDLKLGEDEWLALDAQDYLGVRGTLLIRDKDQALLLEDHVIERQGIISAAQPQIMESWSGNGYRYGVYDLGKNSWILEPQYDVIAEAGETSFYSTKPVDDTNRTLWDFYDQDWNPLWNKELENPSAVFVLNGSDTEYVWVHDQTKLGPDREAVKTYIFDREGKDVRTIETPQTGKNYYYAWDDTENRMQTKVDGLGKSLYEADGTLLFDRTMIPENVVSEIKELVNVDSAGPVTAERFLRGGRLAVLEFEYQEFLYDRETGELLSGAGDLLEWSHDEDHGRFAVDEPFPEAVQVLGQDGSATIYRYDRTSPETKDGRPYLHLVRGIPDQDVQYYYRIDEGKLTLGDGNGAEYVYSGDFDENTTVSPYFGPVVMFSNEENDDFGMSVYDGEDLIMSGRELQVDSVNQNYIIENPETGEWIFIGADGNHCKGKEGQKNRLAGDGFSVIRDKETGFAILDQAGKPVVILDSSYEYPHEEKPLIYDYDKTSSAVLRGRAAG